MGGATLFVPFCIAWSASVLFFVLFSATHARHVLLNVGVLVHFVEQGSFTTFRFVLFLVLNTNETKTIVGVGP